MRVFNSLFGFFHSLLGVGEVPVRVRRVPCSRPGKPAKRPASLCHEWRNRQIPTPNQEKFPAAGNFAPSRCPYQPAATGYCFAFGS
jgi:hypothetical protein